MRQRDNKHLVSFQYVYDPDDDGGKLDLLLRDSSVSAKCLIVFTHLVLKKIMMIPLSSCLFSPTRKDVSGFSYDER